MVGKGMDGIGHARFPLGDYQQCRMGVMWKLQASAQLIGRAGVSMIQILLIAFHISGWLG